MTDRDFDTILRFKAGAGIAVLAAWVRELRDEYERVISNLKNQLKSCCEEIDDLKKGGAI